MADDCTIKVKCSISDKIEHQAKLDLRSKQAQAEMYLRLGMLLHEQSGQRYYELLSMVQEQIEDELTLNNQGNIE